MSEPTAKGTVTVHELTRAQQAVARRVAEARAIVPDLTLRATATARRPPGLGRIVNAAATALREHPRANASYRDNRFELYSRVNVGVATAAQDALVFPTIFDADTKDADAIAEEIAALGERAVAGTLTAAETSGATFSVYAISRERVTGYTPVLVPPQAATLAAGAPYESRIELTLVCDHRILYGHDAAAFLGRIAELLSD